MQRNNDTSYYRLSADSLVESTPSAAIPTNSCRVSSMSSRANKASSTLSTATGGTRALALKGDQDAPPANAGWYATPTTMGRDADLQPLLGAGDASPANLGWYATAATTARDDDSTHKKIMIQTLIEDQQHRSNKINYALGALRLTVDKEELRAAFPQRIVKHPSDAQHERDRFTFHPDYINHLASVMRQSSEVLNDFLQTAGSRQIFTYGTSKYYEGQTFEEVLYHEWPVQTVVLHFEKRLLERIATAFKAIRNFMPNTTQASGRSSPCPVSPTSTDHSTSRMRNTLHGKDLIITSPSREDSLWTGEVAEQVLATFNLTVTGNEVRPPTITAPAQHASTPAIRHQRDPDITTHKATARSSIDDTCASAERPLCNSSDPPTAATSAPQNDSPPATSPQGAELRIEARNCTFTVQSSRDLGTFRAASESKQRRDAASELAHKDTIVHSHDQDHSSVQQDLDTKTMLLSTVSTTSSGCLVFYPSLILPPADQEPTIQPARDPDKSSISPLERLCYLKNTQPLQTLQLLTLNRRPLILSMQRTHEFERPREQPDSRMAGPSDGQQIDCSATSRRVDAELASIPFTHDNLSGATTGYGAWKAIGKSGFQVCHDPTMDKKGISTPDGTPQQTLEPFDSALILLSDCLQAPARPPKVIPASMKAPAPPCDICSSNRCSCTVPQSPQDRTLAASMSTYNQHLEHSMFTIERFRVFALSNEFKLISVRQDEKFVLSKLLERILIPIKESVDKPSASREPVARLLHGPDQRGPGAEGKVQDARIPLAPQLIPSSSDQRRKAKEELSSKRLYDLWGIQGSRTNDSSDHQPLPDGSAERAQHQRTEDKRLSSRSCDVLDLSKVRNAPADMQPLGPTNMHRLASDGCAQASAGLYYTTATPAGEKKAMTPRDVKHTEPRGPHNSTYRTTESRAEVKLQDQQLPSTSRITQETSDQLRPKASNELPLEPWQDLSGTPRSRPVSASNKWHLTAENKPLSSRSHKVKESSTEPQMVDQEVDQGLLVMLNQLMISSHNCDNRAKLHHPLRSDLNSNLARHSLPALVRTPFKGAAEENSQDTREVATSSSISSNPSRALQHAIIAESRDSRHFSNTPFLSPDDTLKDRPNDLRTTANRPDDHPRSHPLQVRHCSLAPSSVPATPAWSACKVSMPGDSREISEQSRTTVPSGDCDAMPAQSRSDDSEDQPYRTLAVARSTSSYEERYTIERGDRQQELQLSNREDLVSRISNYRVRSTALNDDCSVTSAQSQHAASTRTCQPLVPSLQNQTTSSTSVKTTSRSNYGRGYTPETKAQSDEGGDKQHLAPYNSHNPEPCANTYENPILCLGTRAPAPRGDRDAPPANAGWHAVPATTGRDVDPQRPSGTGDASPANQGRYAAAATTARDDGLAVKRKKASIEALAEDTQHQWTEDRRRSSRSLEFKESPTEPRTVDQEQPTQPLRDPDKPSASRLPHLSVLLCPPAGNDSEIAFKRLRDLLDRQGPRDSKPHTENQPQTRDLQMPSTSRLALHSSDQLCQMTNHEAFLGPLRNPKDIPLVRALRLTNQQVSWIAGPSDSQQIDCPDMSRLVDMEVAPTPIWHIGLSGIVSSNCARQAICESSSHHYSTRNKKGTSTLVGTQRTFEPLNPTAISLPDYLRDGEDFLGFTNVVDLLGVGKNCLSDEPYQAPKLLYTSISYWTRLATTLIYLGEIPTMTGWEDLARHYPASPQPAKHELVIRPLRDPDKRPRSRHPVLLRSPAPLQAEHVVGLASTSTDTAIQACDHNGMRPKRVFTLAMSGEYPAAHGCNSTINYHSSQTQNPLPRTAEQGLAHRPLRDPDEGLDSTRNDTTALANDHDSLAIRWEIVSSLATSSDNITALVQCCKFTIGYGSSEASLKASRRKFPVPASLSKIATDKSAPTSYATLTRQYNDQKVFAHPSGKLQAIVRKHEAPHQTRTRWKQVTERSERGALRSGSETSPRMRVANGRIRPLLGDSHENSMCAQLVKATQQPQHVTAENAELLELEQLRESLTAAQGDPDLCIWPIEDLETELDRLDAALHATRHQSQLKLPEATLDSSKEPTILQVNLHCARRDLNASLLRIREASRGSRATRPSGVEEDRLVLQPHSLAASRLSCLQHYDIWRAGINNSQLNIGHLPASPQSIKYEATARTGRSKLLSQGPRLSSPQEFQHPSTEEADSYSSSRSTGSPPYYASQSWAGSKPRSSQAPSSPRIAQRMLNQFHPRTSDKASFGRQRDFTDSRALRCSGMEDNLLVSPTFNSNNPPRILLASPECFSRLRVFTSARRLAMNWPLNSLREITTINCTPASTDAVDNREATHTRPKRFCNSTPADKDTMVQTIASAGAAALPYSSDTLMCYRVQSVYPTFTQRQTTEATKPSHEAAFEDTSLARASCSSDHQLLLAIASSERTGATKCWQWRAEDKWLVSQAYDSSISRPRPSRFDCLKASTQAQDTAQQPGPRAPSHSDTRHLKVPNSLLSSGRSCKVSLGSLTTRSSHGQHPGTEGKPLTLRSLDVAEFPSPRFPSSPDLRHLRIGGWTQYKRLSSASRLWRNLIEYATVPQSNHVRTRGKPTMHQPRMPSQEREEDTLISLLHCESHPATSSGIRHSRSPDARRHTFELLQSPRIPGTLDSRHPSTEKDSSYCSRHDSAERKDSWVASPSDSQRNNYSALTGQVDVESSTSSPCGRWSAIACGDCAQSARRSPTLSATSRHILEQPGSTVILRSHSNASCQLTCNTNDPSSSRLPYSANAWHLQSDKEHSHRSYDALELQHTRPSSASQSCTNPTDHTTISSTVHSDQPTSSLRPRLTTGSTTEILPTTSSIKRDSNAYCIGTGEETQKFKHQALVRLRN